MFLNCTTNNDLFLNGFNLEVATEPETWLAGWLAGSQAWLAGPQAWLDGPGGDVRMNERTYVRKISPFYRTSSPIGAAAQKAGELSWKT